MSPRRNLLIVMTLLVLSVAAAGAQPVAGVSSRRLPPGGVDVRRNYLRFATAPLREMGAVDGDEVQSRESGIDFLVSVQDSRDFRYLLFVPKLNGEYPVYSAGTYIIRRRKSDGGIDQLKIFLRNDPRFFVRILPRDETTSTMSVFLANTEIHHALSVPLGLEAILAEPLELLLQLVSGRVEWQLFFPETDDPRYGVVQRMASAARSMLHTLPDAEDGAMDASGNLVFIESLVLQDQQPGFNCSGFAKWIVDGLHMELYGSFLSVDELKTKHLDLRGNRWSEPLEDERDPYFGLDWTRNLATTMLSAEQGGQEMHPEAADVRDVRFSPYIEDVGYPVERLAQIMYLLAIKEPGYFY
ncbi:MAG: hypothetical protein E4H09_03090, partial [Spirochaetales bacterium]